MPAIKKPPRPISQPGRLRKVVSTDLPAPYHNALCAAGGAGKEGQLIVRGKLLSLAAVQIFDPLHNIPLLTAMDIFKFHFRPHRNIMQRGKVAFVVMTHDNQIPAGSRA